MFKTLITQPLFNLLLVIFAFVPGNDFGVALIIFTILIRVLLWPLLKKQHHQQRAMRELQPEIAKIKKSVKGDKQKEAELMMELYKEKEINPLSSIGVAFLQLPILLALFYVIRDVVAKKGFASLTYGWVQSLPFITDIIANPKKLEIALFGAIDLTKHAMTKVDGQTTWYLPALVLVICAAAAQFIQSKQMMASQGQSKSLREILNDAKSGKKTNDQAAGLASSMTYTLPIITLVIGLNFPAALSLYWFVSSGVAIIQQRILFSQDLVNIAKTDVVVRRIEPKSATKPKASSRKKSGKK